MKHLRRMALFVFSMVLLPCLLAACAPSPDNGQIETAIQASLAREAEPPALAFDTMEVPMRSAGKANAVLWTADGEVQRNYAISYNKETRSFAVTSYTTSRKSEDGTYYFVPNDPNLVLTDLAHCFPFSDNFEQAYMLFYVGKGGDLNALRTAYEREKLPALTDEQLASFEVCDLGGDTLILLVPRYKGLHIWINEIEHHGDVMRQGPEVARFENGLPVYICCSFSDKLPPYEIHISFDSLGEFFLTREALLESLP